MERCQWKQEGYNEFDIPLPESSLSLNSYSSIKLGMNKFYKKSILNNLIFLKFSFVIDVKTQNKILREAKERDSTMKIG